MSAADDGTLPLAGRTVAITRAAEQAGPLRDQLVLLGATVIDLPLIEIRDPAEGGAALRDAMARVAGYEWIVLTSPNAAERTMRALAELSNDAFVPRIAVVGPGTADVVAQYGHRVELIADRAVGEGLVASFPDVSGSGAVLLPRAAAAREVVPNGLRAKGWRVDVVEAYQTVAVTPAPDVLASALAADILAFTSSSTVRHFVAALDPTNGNDAIEAFDGLERGEGREDREDSGDRDIRDVREDRPRAARVRERLPTIVTIGPETTETAQTAGLEVTKTADPHTLTGLITAILESA